MSDDTQLFDPMGSGLNKSVKSVKVTRRNRTVNKFTIYNFLCIIDVLVILIWEQTISTVTHLSKFLKLLSV